VIDYKKESFVRRMLGEYDIVSFAALQDPDNRRGVRGDSFWTHVKEGLPWCEFVFLLRNKQVKRVPFHLSTEWKIQKWASKEDVTLWFEWAHKRYGSPPAKITFGCGDLGSERERVLYEE
jgi:hypothetical protein